MAASVSVETVRAIPFFQDLGHEDLAHLRDAVTEESFERGAIIQHEGETCRAMYVVREGRVRVFKTSPDGRIQVLKVMGPGETLNEVPVFDGGANPATIEAVEPTNMLVIGKDAIRRLVHQRPAVALALLGAFARKLRHFTRLVENLSFKTVTARLAQILLDLGTPGGAAPRAAAGPPPRMTQEELAAMVGTAREVVGRALKALEREGALRIERQRIVILDPDALRKHL